MWLTIIATLEGTLPFARGFVHIMPFILHKPPLIQALINPISEENEVHRGAQGYRVAQLISSGSVRHHSLHSCAHLATRVYYNTQSGSQSSSCLAKQSIKHTPEIRACLLMGSRAATAGLCSEA